MGVAIVPRNDRRNQAKALLQNMGIGNFHRALSEFDKLQRGGWIKKIRSLNSSDPKRFPFVAIAAELFFYLGRNQLAHELLGDYVGVLKDSVILHDEYSARAKLQVAEFFYSCEDCDAAVKVVEQVLAHCGSKDPWGAGEGHYYLARYYSRVHQYEAATRHCGEAIHQFLQGVPSNEMVPPLRWRLGLVHLVAGFNAWRAGNLIEAKSRLGLARWLLEPTGDSINLANVHQSFGVMLRSTGDYRDSEKALLLACEQYEESQHHVNLAHVHMNLGRTYFQNGNTMKARKNLERALAISEKIGNVRLKAETLVWTSWLYQEMQDLQKARSYAQEAMNLAIKHETLFIEAEIALGTCLVRESEHERARTQFSDAMTRAMQLKLPKLEIHAHLALAELACAHPTRDVRAAEYHYEHAKGLLGSDPRSVSAYLVTKADRIKHVIAGFSQEFFMATGEDIVSKQGLKAITKKLQLWAVEQADRTAQGNKNLILEMLKVSRPGYDKLRKRLGLNPQKRFRRKANA